MNVLYYVSTGLSLLQEYYGTKLQVYASMSSEPSRLIDHHELLSRVPYSRVQIWRLERQGRFPRRLRIGPNRVAWIESEIEGWINARKQERGVQ